MNTTDNNGNYLLHSAINNDDKELFKELLQKEANVSIKDANGDNAYTVLLYFKRSTKLHI
ncbi:MAG: hypothetical protein ACR5K2_01485 [Wolbachia sp.]